MVMPQREQLEFSSKSSWLSRTKLAQAPVAIKAGLAVAEGCVAASEG